MKKNCCLLVVFMVFLIFYSTALIAQDSSQTPPGFPLGVFSHIADDDPTSTSVYLLKQAGINYIVDGVNGETQAAPFNLMAIKLDTPQDYIGYYSKGFYTRWEAEKSEYNFLETGFKHPHPTPWGTGPYLYGEPEYYDSAWCWATDSTSEFSIDSVLWGPNYRQLKKYKTGLVSDPWVDYTANYRLALRYTGQYNDTTSICKLSIRYRFERHYNQVIVDTQTIVLADTILRVSDFPTESLSAFLLEYTYPEERFESGYLGKFPEEMYLGLDTVFVDDKHLTGIEFHLDWYGVGKLYIDYVGVYDNEIGFDIVNYPSTVRQNLIEYADSYSGWGPIEYWYVNDDPNTMDSYEPMRIVDSIITNYASFNKPIITEIYPHWRGYMNGDLYLQKFVELTKPKQLMIDRYPFVDGYTTEWGLTELRKSFQLAADAQPGFWYVGQGFAQRLSQGGDICRWRLPDSSELNASVMLALAHGSKGIMFWHFSPNGSANPIEDCGVNQHMWFDGIVGEDLTPTDLYWYIKDGLSPRLGGKLGKTLLTLIYTGEYINMEYEEGIPPEDNEQDYLSIQHYGMSYFWHAGFFQKQNQTGNKHFLLANLRTNMPVEAKLIVSNNTGYENVSFTDIEGGSGRVDTTIDYNSSITYYETMPAGEGRLYRVSPVVKYGGRLIYDEEIVSETLYDDMVIENGATLRISGDYYVDADIIVKDGGSIVNTGNGKITFYNDHKLILQGNSTLSSLSQNKLVLDFVSPTENNGIIADSGLVIIISNCEIKNAGTGITVSSFSSLPPESDDFRFRVDSVDFIYCEEFSINITGQYVNKAMIENSSFTGSAYGVSAVNLDETVIFNNYFTNTEMGIRLINITKADVIGNGITSNQYSMQGIFLDNSGGNLRANIVQGHTNGIHLGNSSPDIGCKLKVS